MFGDIKNLKEITIVDESGKSRVIKTYERTKPEEKFIFTIYRNDEIVCQKKATEEELVANLKASLLTNENAYVLDYDVFLET